MGIRLQKQWSGVLENYLVPLLLGTSIFLLTTSKHQFNYMNFGKSTSIPGGKECIRPTTVQSNSTVVSSNISSCDNGWPPFNEGELTVLGSLILHSYLAIWSEEAKLLEPDSSDPSSAIEFLEAWKLPGVAPFAFCLSFSKLVAYNFLYWLAFCILHKDIGWFMYFHIKSICLVLHVQISQQNIT